MGKVKTLLKRLTTGEYIYDATKYADSFVTAASRGCEYYAKGDVPRVVYCCWTGDNEMSPNRLNALKTLKANIGVGVTLVTPDNLSAFILPEHPLHKGFQYLSLVHRADYLRCYLMHHYGGGYADIKVFKRSWKLAFDELNSRADKWIIGYREIGRRGVAFEEGVMGADLKRYWHLLLGNCSFICRPHTPFTQEWYDELLERMDFYYERLVKNPGNAFGTNQGYPIPWVHMLGHIFHPLCLKYSNRLLYSGRLKFDPVGYR